MTEEDDDIVRQWLTAVMRSKKLKPTPFAREVGLAPSTLIRALDPKNPTQLERASIAKIMAKFGVPGPYQQALGSVAAAFAGDLSPPERLPPTLHTRPLLPDQYVRQIRTRVLELAGYMPGDLVIFDASTAPRTGDAVIANVVSASGTESVFRIYEAPYIVTRTMEDAARAKPLLVDDERVRIIATAIAAVRERAA